ncbi:MAG: hypothetical protein ACPG1C_06350 [Alphaproteobacteria bacterium]
MTRGLMIAGALLVLILGGALAYLLTNAGEILESAIESYGPEMTQSDVTVDDVDLSPTDGEGEIKGFEVDNPDGYETKKALTLGSIALGIDPATIGEDVIVIRKVHVTQPSVTVEIAEDGSTNLEHLQRNVMAYVENLQKAVEEQTGGGSSGGGANDGTESGVEQKFILEDFRLTGGEVTVHSKFLNLGEISSDLPDILMSDIGKRQGGMTGGELAAVLLDKVKGDALGAVQRLDLADVNKMLDGGVDALKQQGLDRIDKELGEGAGQAVEELGKAFGDMF